MPVKWLLLLTCNFTADLYDFIEHVSISKSNWPKPGDDIKHEYRFNKTFIIGSEDEMVNLKVAELTEEE